MKVKILESTSHMFYKGTIFPSKEVEAEQYKSDLTLVEISVEELNRVGLYLAWPYDQQPSALLSFTHNEVELVEEEESNYEFYTGDQVVHNGLVFTLLYYGIEYSSVKSQDKQIYMVKSNNIQHKD